MCIRDRVDEAAGVGVFDLKLELAWVIDGETTVREVRLDQARHAFVVPMAADPQQVRVDPGAKVLLKLDFNPGDDKLKTQLRHAPDVIGRIRAARELCKTGKRANVRAVAAAYDEEPFWGVRAAWADALAGAGTSDALEALARLVGVEQDARVLEPLIRSAAAFRDCLLYTSDAADE